MFYTDWRTYSTSSLMISTVAIRSAVEKDIFIKTVVLTWTQMLGIQKD